jgi:hypothetical protein
MNSPTIAVTNSRVDISWTERIADSAGMTVRYGSSAQPRTVHATSQAAARRASFGEPSNAARFSRMRTIPMRPPRAAPRIRIERINDGSCAGAAPGGGSRRGTGGGSPVRASAYTGGPTDASSSRPSMADSTLGSGRP